MFNGVWKEKKNGMSNGKYLFNNINCEMWAFNINIQHHCSTSFAILIWFQTAQETHERPHYYYYTRLSVSRESNKAENDFIRHSNAHCVCGIFSFCFSLSYRTETWNPDDVTFHGINFRNGKEECHLGEGLSDSYVFCCCCFDVIRNKKKLNSLEVGWFQLDIVKQIQVMFLKLLKWCW